MGVEVDGNGRPVAYHIWNRHRMDLQAAGRARVRIPADQIVHKFRAYRPGQTRGIPLLTPILLINNMLDGYSVAHLIQARAAATTGGGFFVATGEDAAAMMPAVATTTPGEEPKYATARMRRRSSRSVAPNAVGAGRCGRCRPMCWSGSASG